MNTKHPQATAGEAKAKPQVIKLGLDLHARQVTECRQLDGSTPKPAQKWNPGKLLDQVEAWVKAAIQVYSCYEAGACGYWYHRELVRRGAVNFVVAPRPLENQRTKRQTTDRLDALGLLDGSGANFKKARCVGSIALGKLASRACQMGPKMKICTRTPQGRVGHRPRRIGPTAFLLAAAGHTALLHGGLVQPPYLLNLLFKAIVRGDG